MNRVIILDQYIQTLWKKFRRLDGIKEIDYPLGTTLNMDEKSYEKFNAYKLQEERDKKLTEILK